MNPKLVVSTLKPLIARLKFQFTDYMYIILISAFFYCTFARAQGPVATDLAPRPVQATPQDQQPQMLRSAPMSELPPTVQMPGCISNAQSGYKGKKCVVYINRLAPVSPPALIVPKGTTVYVVLYNTRWNEAVTFASAVSKTTIPDVAAAALKNVGSPLQSLVTSVVKNKVGFAGGSPGETDPSKQQTELKDKFNNLQANLNHANAAMTCLSNYESLAVASIDPVTKVPRQYSCSQANLLTPTSFYDTWKTVVDDANNAATAPLPVASLKRMDAGVDKMSADCIDTANPPSDECQVYVNNRALLDSALTAIQSAQASLSQNVRLLNAWPGTPDNVAYEFVAPKLNNLILTISGQEIVNKVVSPIATVTVNTQANSWVVSAGIGFSNLKYHTYTIAPIISNGQPVLDGTGKVTTIVTQQTQSPSVIAPEGLLSYRLTRISRQDWENRCPNGCSFLLTGGIGANLTSKSADFDVGPSFQVGGLLFTPTVHFGRDTRLTNGVQVGQKLGSSPPSSLPTANSWVIKGGFTLTYTIPIT